MTPASISGEQLISISGGIHPPSDMPPADLWGAEMNFVSKADSRPAARTLVAFLNGKNYEQIDGVVEINHYLTLVEMKWEKEPIGVDKVARFMFRLLVRKNVDGVIISYSSFAETAIPTSKEGLSRIFLRGY